jgi:hypothetical protein
MDDTNDPKFEVKPSAEVRERVKSLGRDELEQILLENLGLATEDAWKALFAKKPAPTEFLTDTAIYEFDLEAKLKEKLGEERYQQLMKARSTHTRQNLADVPLQQNPARIEFMGQDTELARAKRVAGLQRATGIISLAKMALQHSATAMVAAAFAPMAFGGLAPDNKSIDASYKEHSTRLRITAKMLELAADAMEGSVDGAQITQELVSLANDLGGPGSGNDQ